MLLQLNIKNFALIEDLTINFEKGFNVLTGETGAGKSILIDAINYVLGGKFNKSLIRTGENRTFVEAIFDILNSNTKKIMNEMEIEYNDLLIISRETFKSGKSIVKINGKSILLSNVKKIANTLINIHGQHENQELLDSASHINYLDKFGDDRLNNVLKQYSEKYNQLLDIDKRIRQFKSQDEEKEKLTDFLKYQIEEINNARLKIGEDKKLEERYAILNNAEKINNALSNSYNILYNSNDTFISVYDCLNRVIRELKNVDKHMDKLKNITNSVEDTYFNIEQIISEIRNMQESIHYDKNELEYVNSRIFQIDSLKRKYGKTIEDILQYKKRIEKQYNDIIHSEKIIEELKKERIKTIQELVCYGKEIHNIRVDIGKVLEKRIKEELDYVGLEKSILRIKVDFQDEFYDNGCDKVQFLISTNPGEPLKALDKVVSGGELSRIMLSLKTVFVDKDEIPSVIFDEIDTGISGRIAQRVAEKMYLISNAHQVFCVTHLPQIASMSDAHFLVSKNVVNKKTFTTIKEIDNLQKEHEIARMIGGSEITELTLKNSKEMVNLAYNRKKELVLHKNNS
ncbi:MULTISPECIES: DNA repair protein RecN [Clostridium]|uniref:DNA repair protein RecN n=2 Tax=Clostridium TaxID=1485 RepID=A0A151AQB1_9CLOT|nr:MULTISPECIES: DNA repair protein RecN [Clostridium]MBE6078984.1 DNA repair protein RecN [Clostridium lundense]KYH29826.1 DNA repair protein RecN [Clostridium colicanis DSM 13634]MBE6042715.1 DNA repair protein RecN [Clostridium thermopalmarium]PRR75207.1 DNA repair protein RecN [Clostridium thermopalmarium DSM 5974]PVZ27963.1 DNA replication and repair protein RecN [Clostridium thermopalmarium DSM 5974]